MHRLLFLDVSFGTSSDLRMSTWTTAVNSELWETSAYIPSISPTPRGWRKMGEAWEASNAAPPRYWVSLISPRPWRPRDVAQVPKPVDVSRYPETPVGLRYKIKTCPLCRKVVTTWLRPLTSRSRPAVGGGGTRSLDYWGKRLSYGLCLWLKGNLWVRIMHKQWQMERECVMERMRVMEGIETIGWTLSFQKLLYECNIKLVVVWSTCNICTLYLFLCVLRANCLFLLPFKRSLPIIEQSVKQVSLCELAPLSFLVLKTSTVKIIKKGRSLHGHSQFGSRHYVNIMFTLHLLNGMWQLQNRQNNYHSSTNCKKKSLKSYYSELSIVFSKNN